MYSKFLKDISPREYQKTIYETCREKNTLVVLPTGLGKPNKNRKTRKVVKTL